jgi:hypothetical protein
LSCPFTLLSFSLSLSLRLGVLRRLRRLTLRGEGDEGAQLVIIFTLLVEPLVDGPHLRLRRLDCDLFLRVKSAHRCVF